LCLLRRERQLTSEEEISPTVEERLEAAVSWADHLDPVRIFKTLLSFSRVR